MGAPDINYAAPTSAETTAEMLQAFTDYLPGLTDVTNRLMIPQEQAQLAAAREVAPGYAEIQRQIYDTIGRDLNRIGTEYEREQALAQAATNRDVIAGPGREQVAAALETAKIADPEYFRTRELMGQRLEELLAPGITGGEEAAMERAINRDRTARGTLGVTPALDTVKAATQFGDAARNRVAQGIQIATGAAPVMRTGVNPFEVRETRTSSTVGAIPGVQPGQYGQQTQAFAQNFMGEVAQNQRAAMGANASAANAAMSQYQSPWNIARSFMPSVGFGFGG